MKHAVGSARIAPLLRHWSNVNTLIGMQHVHRGSLKFQTVYLAVVCCILDCSYSRSKRIYDSWVEISDATTATSHLCLQASESHKDLSFRI